MIVTLTPNPALDLSYHVDGFPVGDVLRVDPPAARAGGKGLNVARVLTQLGEPVRAIATAGGSTGTELSTELGKAGIPHVLVPVAAETRRSIAIIDTGSRLTTVMNERGRALTDAETEAMLVATRSALGSASVLVVSGSLPPGFPPAAIADLVHDAHAAGAAAIVDTTGEGLLAACAAGVDAVKPNGDELRATTGDGDPVRGARRLIAAGARLVVVTLGADGMLAIAAADPARVVRARLPRPVEGNPTGAGDAAVAALAAGIHHGESALAPLLTRAVAWSAAAVAHPLAGSLADGWNEFERLVIIEEDMCP